MIPFFRLLTVSQPYPTKSPLDTHSHRQKIAENEPGAKAILPELRGVKNPNSYQLLRKIIPEVTNESIGKSS